MHNHKITLILEFMHYIVLERSYMIHRFCSWIAAGWEEVLGERV